MLTVTDMAKKKLLENLQKQILKSIEAFRIIPSPSKQKALAWTTDTEKEGDQVVKSKDWIKVLLIASDLALVLEGMVLDYGEKAEYIGFTIKKLASDTWSPVLIRLTTFSFLSFEVIKKIVSQIEMWKWKSKW